MSVVPSATSGVILNQSIAAPGTAEQLASHAVPEGMEIVVTARHPTNTQSMYVAFSKAAAQSGAREVFARGRSASYRLGNTNLLWVDADNANDVLEVRIQKIPSTGG